MSVTLTNLHGSIILMTVLQQNGERMQSSNLYQILPPVTKSLKIGNKFDPQIAPLSLQTPL